MFQRSSLSAVSSLDYVEGQLSRLSQYAAVSEDCAQLRWQALRRPGRTWLSPLHC